MTVFMAGMVLGGCGQTTVYAAEETAVYEENTEEVETVNEVCEDVEYVEDILKNEPADVENEENILESAGEDEVPEESDLKEDETEKDDPVSDGTEEDTEDVSKKSAMDLDVVTDEASVKAGSDLVCTVTLENTGDVMLKNIRICYSTIQETLKGEWSEEQAHLINTDGNTVNIDQLDAGMKKLLYLTVKLPEEQEEAVSVKIAASAEPETTEEDDSQQLIREKELVTNVIPLKASFEVTKTADRSVAVPGDKILFQICIRNTGERTLHSVITTERFQLGNVPVQFLEKEGVVLNSSKTKARIEKIEPGKAAGLQAMVTLPENIKEQELLNEVTVTTLETGEQVMTSQSKIQVKAAEEIKEKTEDSVDNDSVDTDGGAVSHTGESYPASTHPKTGDPYQPLLWLAMIPGSLLAAGWIRRRM